MLQIEYAANTSWTMQTLQTFLMRPHKSKIVSVGWKSRLLGLFILDNIKRLKKATPIHVTIGQAQINRGSLK